MQLNELPNLVEIIKATESTDENGKETALITFKTNRFQGYMILGEAKLTNLFSSYIEQIGIGFLNEPDTDYYIFNEGWVSPTNNNDIRDLARKVVMAVSDLTGRNYGRYRYQR